MIRFVFLLLICLRALAHAGELDGVHQLVVTVAPDWNSTSGELHRFEREGKGWREIGEPWAVLLGRNGSAWGRGVLGQDEKGTHKYEQDGRSPAGLFRIGTIYTYDTALPTGADFPFYTVTERDTWIDDAKLPYYNQHVVVDLASRPPWYARHRMKLGDFAYRWLVEIRHNSDPPLPGGGSAIFFHIRRGPQRTTSGCTTMAEADLVTLIRWLWADAKPHYVLLPREEYAGRQKAWGLPPL